MATFTGSDDLRGAEFFDVSLRGARFIRSSLARVVMRGVEIEDANIDSPWLLEDGGSLLVNGVDVAPLVDAELNRRFPGRQLRHAAGPDGLREAWAVLQETWDTTGQRLAGLPPGTEEISVDGEWSFAQTMRHLVMATDKWLRGAVLGIEPPYHPMGLPNAEYETDGLDMSVFQETHPSYDEVLKVRAGRVAMVRDFIAGATEEELQRTHPAPDDSRFTVTTLDCLHVILHEEWEHHRFAVRDLDAIEAKASKLQDRAPTSAPD
ncbi:DinB family protein [Arthrobacter sp. AG258]|uniref:DinB family protein n=1 Tax=Arthrobacter sp. AG258 TaxID=2183899 RepID=UPI00105DB881|nr:DinB family protein [Arthrobacter sp. AG258]